jgi:rhomboid protease GluP
MFRQRSGSSLCYACGKLNGADAAVCFYCGARRPGLWGFGPLLRRVVGRLDVAQLVTVVCIVAYVASLLLDPRAALRARGPFDILAPSNGALYLLGATGALPWAQGRWWTIFTAIYLHGSLLHILFNLMWVRQLVPATESMYGIGRTIIIYTLASATGFLASALAGEYLRFLPVFLQGASFTIGASAPVFGLLGALVYSGRRGASSALGQQALGYALTLFIFGFLMPGVDNWAHFGGFAGGYAAARWLDPLLAERGDHLIMGLICLALSLAAIALSFWLGWSLLYGH